MSGMERSMENQNIFVESNIESFITYKPKVIRRVTYPEICKIWSADLWSGNCIDSTQTAKKINHALIEVIVPIFPQALILIAWAGCHEIGKLAQSIPDTHLMIAVGNLEHATGLTNKQA